VFPFTATTSTAGCEALDRWGRLGRNGRRRSSRTRAASTCSSEPTGTQTEPSAAYCTAETEVPPRLRPRPPTASDAS
jgi:hypothetical protein